MGWIEGLALASSHPAGRPNDRHEVARPVAGLPVAGRHAHSVRGEVAWLLPEGEKTYWRGTIDSIAYRFAP